MHFRSGSGPRRRSLQPNRETVVEEFGKWGLRPGSTLTKGFQQLRHIRHSRRPNSRHVSPELNPFPGHASRDRHRKVVRISARGSACRFSCVLAECGLGLRELINPRKSAAEFERFSDFAASSMSTQWTNLTIFGRPNWHEWPINRPIPSRADALQGWAKQAKRPHADRFGEGTWGKTATDGLFPALCSITPVDRSPPQSPARAFAKEVSSPIRINPHFSSTRIEPRLSLAARAYRGRPQSSVNCARARLARP